MSLAPKGYGKVLENWVLHSKALENVLENWIFHLMENWVLHSKAVETSRKIEIAFWGYGNVWLGKFSLALKDYGEVSGNWVLHSKVWRSLANWALQSNAIEKSCKTYIQMLWKSLRKLSLPLKAYLKFFQNWVLNSKALKKSWKIESCCWRRLWKSFEILSLAVKAVEKSRKTESYIQRLQRTLGKLSRALKGYEKALFC